MKKLIALLLSFLLLFSFCGCSDANLEPEGWYSETGINLTQKQLNGVINQDFETPKNVIVIIGDGMGPNDITLAEKHQDGTFEFGLALNLITNHGLANTHSADAAVTDSAASGTALSTGEKTNNGYIGKDTSGADLKTMAETAREAGKKVGIITDEDIAGATPSAFVVHNISRSNTKELTNDIIKFKPDVLMAKDYNGTFPRLEGDAKNIFNNEYLVAKDFNRFKEVLDSDPNCEKPFFGFLNGYATVASDNLAQCAQVAMKRLKNDNGFFLMIESSGTDKFGHSNNINGKLASVVTLDRTVAAVLAFMKNNPDTLLIITSDHETGGVQLPEGDDYKLPDLLTVNEHTSTPVCVFAVGKGSEYFKDKTVDNTEIAKFVIKAIKGE